MKDEVQLSVGQFGDAAAERAAQVAPDAVVVVDPDNRIIIANVRAEEMFGYTSVELRAMDAGTLIREQLRAGHETQLAGHFANPEARPASAPIELVGRRKDGGEFPVEISLGRPARHRDRLSQPSS
jgi:PAS domain S-box-containing protein